MRHYYSARRFLWTSFLLKLVWCSSGAEEIRDAGINPPKETQVTQEEYRNNSHKPGQSNVTGPLFNSLAVSVDSLYQHRK